MIQKLLFFTAEKLKNTGSARGKIKSLLFPLYLLFCRVQWKMGNLYLYHVELPITTRCSLKCKNCSFMMPYFKDPHDYNVEDLLLYMDRLFECVDTIQIFRILGGEPLLYDGGGDSLARIISKAVNSSKVKTVDVVTNGTIIPKQVVLDVMKNPRLTLQISDYGTLSRKKDELKSLCDTQGIKCVIRSEKKKNWNDAGGLENRHRSKKELLTQMKHCGNICRSFHNGRLYYCPRQSFGTKLGISDNIGDRVDFTKDSDKEVLRRQVYELNQIRILGACNYCDEGTKNLKECVVAEQIQIKDK